MRGGSTLLYRSNRVRLRYRCRVCLVVVVEAFQPQEHRAPAQLFLDAEKLVVLGDAVGAADRAGLDLAYAGGYG